MAAACVFGSGALARGGSVNLARDGRSPYVIVVAADAIAAEKTAARELQDYFRQVTGAPLEIVSEADLAGGDAPRILVGQTKLTRQVLADLNFAALQHDGIVMKVAGRNLILTGGRPRGTLYAVDTFLEDVVGVRWWTSTESTVPHTPMLDIPADLNVTYIPKLRYRESFNEDAINDHALFASRLKLNGHMTRIPEALGGHYTIIGWCHTSNALIPPGEFMSTHPEWYALVNGKRQPSQLCLTNDAMRRELTRRALKLVRKHPEAGIISISQNDGPGPCECDVCRAVVKAEGSQSGPWIRLVNQVAADIDKEYPGFLVETLAYQYTRKPPKLTKPSKNVLVRLCSIECDFAHPLESASNRSFGDDLRGWSAIAPNLFIWNYVTSFANYLIPQPNMTSLGQDLRFFVDNHVIGVFEQGDAYNELAGDFLPLRTWLLAHLMWNPQQDQARLREEFLTGYYGAAAPMLAKYLDLVNAPAKDPKFHVGCYNNDISFLTDAAVAEANKLFDDAAKAVAGDAALSRRVSRARLVLDHVNLMRYDFEGAAKAHHDDPAAARAEYRARVNDWAKRARELGVRSLSEGGSFDSYVPVLAGKAELHFPVRLPPAGAALQPNQFDIQENQFQLFGAGRLSELVDDPKASNRRAARMPGGIVDWAVQFHIPRDAKFIGPGPWYCSCVVRVETTAKSGMAFQMGLHDSAGSRYVSIDRPGLKIGADNEYHSYPMIVDSLSPTMYFWFAPPGNGAIKHVYVDRIFIEKRPRK
jgi:hypothetical protein